MKNNAAKEWIVGTSYCTWLAIQAIGFLLYVGGVALENRLRGEGRKPVTRREDHE